MDSPWLDKSGRPVFRLSPDHAWPLPLFTPVTPALPESRVVAIRGRVR